MSRAFEPPVCDSRDGSCHVCGDVAVVGRVVEVNESNRTGTIAFPDASTNMVALDLVDVRVGDQVLVHLGFAIERVTAHE